MVTEPEALIIFDTTLRDGEQSPGCSMARGEKLRVARALAELGVDVIEAGFPAASRGDWESVNAVAREVQGSIICALARCNREDIELAAKPCAMRHATACTCFSLPARSTANTSSTWRRMRFCISPSMPCAWRASCAQTSNSLPRMPRAPSLSFSRRSSKR